MNPEEIKTYLQSGQRNIILIYVLYLIGLITPSLSLVGISVAYAYAYQEERNNLLSSHYQFAFRTFVIGVIGIVLDIITSLTFIGIILYWAIFAWCTVRSIIAIQFLLKNSPHPNPMGFWIK